MDKKIRKGSRVSSAAATSNGSSSSKSVKNNSGGSKRKVLAELTNSLIPTEVLLDLCSNSISSSKAHDLLRRSQASTFPLSKSSQNSKVDSRSDTSIGSSSFNVVRDAQTPQLSNSSSVNLGNGCRKLAEYSRRETLENLDVPRNVGSELFSSTPVRKKMNDDGKLVPEHSSTTPSYKGMNKQKEIPMALDLIHSEKEIPVHSSTTSSYKGMNKQKAIPRALDLIHSEKEIPVHLGSTSVEKLKDKVKETAGCRSSIPIEKLKDEGCATAVPFSSTSAEKGKNKGKAVDVPFRHLNEQAEDKEGSTAMLINQPLTKERRNVKMAISSCPPLWRTRSNRDKLKEVDVKPSKAWSDPNPKQKKRRCPRQQAVPDYSAQDLEKQKAYFQDIDAFELPVEEVSLADLD
ncbi:hypothetical protein M9H77_10772 [Catharanthus roseus]|uniref:Uncharacterized protein n=1 Tax=Catharanthus roseus TaxID=4058 RepID=A0ACC0BCR2_CATRO|nr:hypothetical protein M9H77_10772 [Catharanthus roseus]